jgi:hypothetical protein
MVDELERTTGDVIVFDTVHNLSPTPTPTTNQIRGFEFFPRGMPTQLREAVRQRIEAGQPFRFVYQPDGDPADHFEQICRIVKGTGRMIFAIDEIWYVAPVEEYKLPPTFKWLIFCGRHHNISMIATAQVPSAVSRKFTSQAGEMRLFFLHEPRYLEYFRDFIGPDADQLTKLEPFYYLVWSKLEPSYITGGPK